jgi:valyl-tRNA synthetase
MKELPKAYDPKTVEKRIYKLWVDGGYFKGVVDSKKEPFSIVIPTQRHWSASFGTRFR